MTGLFGPKDPERKKILEMKKQLKKLVKDKDYAKALKLGEDIIKEDSNEFDVLFIVGGIYYLQKKYRTAISYLDKALEIASTDPDILLLKGNSYHSLGENKKALECCNKIKEIDPKNKPVIELLKKLES